MSHLRDLDREVCLQLMTRATLGRLALSTPEGPHIIPVGYALVGETVAVRTSAYSVLGTSARAALVAFQVDQVDEESRSGWSVMVRGRCYVETDSQELARVQEALGDPWVAGARTLYLRLPLEHVTGRVLGSPDDVAPRSTTQG